MISTDKIYKTISVICKNNDISQKELSYSLFGSGRFVKDYINYIKRKQKKDQEFYDKILKYAEKHSIKIK